MSPTITYLAYLLAAVLFVFALKRMSSPKTARLGNLLGAIGMAIAILFTLLAEEPITERMMIRGEGWVFVLVAGLIGAAVGGFFALTVKMTAMPQMVAMFNGFGGLASALVVFAEAWRPASTEGEYYLAITVGLGTLIGWVTFTGSLIAFAKLQEFVISGRPLTFPMQKVLNAVLFVVAAGLIVLWGAMPGARWVIIPLALLAAAGGVLFTIPIGGADMPVVISLLNSYSGLAACATGFVLRNPGLIIAGSLVGSSGIILTRIMCVGMNRSLSNVLFGAVGGAAGAAGGGEERRVTSWTPEDAAMAMSDASYVVVVPGYGMAVAQAQHAVKELADLLTERGVEVKFGIHEVAGRMPGHMNVLLAEAEVDYESLLDREATNAEIERADVALILGANDVVNPSARTAEGSPIYGMPIIDVDKARTTVVCKRSLSPGFAGVDNELFYMDDTAMLFGDGKKSIMAIVAALKEE